MFNSVIGWVFGRNSAETKKDEETAKNPQFLSSVNQSEFLSEDKDATTGIKFTEEEDNNRKSVVSVNDDLCVESVEPSLPSLEIIKVEDDLALEKLEEVVRNIVSAPNNDFVLVKHVLDPARFIIQFSMTNNDVNLAGNCFGTEDRAMMLKNWLPGAFIKASENDGSIIFEQYSSVNVFDMQAVLPEANDSDDEDSTSGESNGCYDPEPAYARGVLLSVPKDDFATVFLYDTGCVKSVSIFEFRALDLTIVNAIPPAYGLLIIPGLVPRNEGPASSASNNSQADSWNPETMKDVTAWFENFEKFALIGKVDVATGIFYGDLQGKGEVAGSVTDAEDMLYSKFMAKKKHSSVNCEY